MVLANDCCELPLSIWSLAQCGMWILSLYGRSCTGWKRKSPGIGRFRRCLAGCTLQDCPWSSWCFFLWTCRCWRGLMTFLQVRRFRFSGAGWNSRTLAGFAFGWTWPLLCTPVELYRRLIHAFGGLLGVRVKLWYFVVVGTWGLVFGFAIAQSGLDGPFFCVLEEVWSFLLVAELPDGFRTVRFGQFGLWQDPPSPSES